MKTSERIGSAILALFLMTVPYADAQTQVDLANQARNVDFSKANSTKPAQVGPTAPSGGCSVGQIYFDYTATGGENLFGCTATNVWTLLSGSSGSGGGASMASQLGDFLASDTSSSTQTLGAGCNVTVPCQIRIGSASFSITAPVSATISGTSANGTVFWYLSSEQILTAGHDSTATLTCAGGCAVATGVTAFPPDSVPLWQTTFTSNQWNPINVATMDERAVYSRDVIEPGFGVVSTSDPSTGVQTLATDPTTVPRYFTGSGAPTLTCTAGRDFFTDITNLHLYFCDAANTWKQADPGVVTRTDVDDFTLVSGSASGASILAAYSTTAAAVMTATGPNTLAYSVAGIPLDINGAVMVTKTASPTWSAAAGTIDVSIYVSNADGAPAAGNWNLNVYAGCATAGGTFSYAVASTITAAPPAHNDFQTFVAAGLALPTSCAASSPLQFWVQRTADSGGTTGVKAFAVSMEVVIRGN